MCPHMFFFVSRFISSLFSPLSCCYAWALLVFALFKECFVIKHKSHHNHGDHHDPHNDHHYHLQLEVLQAIPQVPRRRQQ